MIGLSVYSVWGMSLDSGTIRDMKENEMPLENANNEAMIGLLNQQTGVRGYVITGDEKYLQVFYDGEKQLNDSLEKLNKLSKDNPELATLLSEKGVPIVQEVQDFLNSQIDLVKSNSQEEAIVRLDDGKGTFDEFREIHNQVSNSIAASVESAWEETVKSQNLQRWLMIIGTILAVMLSLYFIYYLIKNISLPVKAVSKTLIKVADGDLKVDKLQVKTEDELKDLSDSLNEMVDTLNSTISMVHDSANQVAASSEELMASSEQSTRAAETIAQEAQHNAEGADTQSRNIHEVTAAIQQMSSGIQQIADDSEQMLHSVEFAEEMTKEGEQVVNTVSDQMREIRNAVKDTSNIISILDDYSKEIGDITALIKDISEQTNLLALNAAIEAARAGEHGRGFAVVADEVRKLAEESKTSAEKISGMVSGIQTEMNRAVHSMNIGNQKVDEGILFTEKASETFNKIEEAASGVASRVENVSSAVEQMTAVTGEIVKAIDNIGQISEHMMTSSQESAGASEEQLATMEEISGAAENLAKLSEEMQSLITHFKIREV